MAVEGDGEIGFRTCKLLSLYRAAHFDDRFGDGSPSSHIFRRELEAIETVAEPGGVDLRKGYGGRG